MMEKQYVGIYGKLNKEIKLAKYFGINSDTASVIINDKNEISVNVKPLNKLNILTKENTYTFNGTKEVTIDFTNLYTDVNNLNKNKLDKTKEINKLYATDSVGNQINLNYDSNLLNDSIVQRTNDGRLKGSAPKENNDLVNKEYFEENTGASGDKASVSGTILNFEQAVNDKVVVPNNGQPTTQELNTLKVRDINYKVVGSGKKFYMHSLSIGSLGSRGYSMEVVSARKEPYSKKIGYELDNPFEPVIYISGIEHDKDYISNIIREYSGDSNSFKVLYIDSSGKILSYFIDVNNFVKDEVREL